jgi:hypothetical protein
MSDSLSSLTADAIRAFRVKQEERISVLLGIPPEDGFARNTVRMTTRADCQCRGSGVLHDLAIPEHGAAIMTLTECPCVRYERVDVRT